MFGFLLFRNLSNTGALASCGVCIALSYVWLRLDDQEKEVERQRQHDLEERARFLRKVNTQPSSFTTTTTTHILPPTNHSKQQAASSQ
jgi:hypothetical protein